MSASKLPRVLLVAGSDSSGGAGLEADQKVAAAHGCYAMTATTALTAQNTQGVDEIHQVPPGFVGKCIDACLDDIGADVVKCGMLASAETIRVVADAVKKHQIQLCVIDPVMVSTSGSRLLPEDAVSTLRQELLPLATVLTPNIPEAQLLLKDAGQDTVEIKSANDLITLARNVQALGPKYVLLKGGHLPLTKLGQLPVTDKDEKIISNVLCGEDSTLIFKSDFLESSSTHGTGCSLASAIACNLALGKDLAGAVREAGQYVETGIKTAAALGHGHGPINHFHSLYRLPFNPGRFIDYVLDHANVKPAWATFTHHTFVSGLADGSLPIAKFTYYLIQDYLYLVQFARANALASYKAKTLDDIAASARIVLHIQAEMKLHLDYCAEFGITKDEVERQEESQACTAYTRYVLDVGQSQDWLALQMALAPCLLGYGAIARRLYSDVSTKREGNIYWKWICNYVAEDYATAVQTGSELLERNALHQSASRIEELVAIFTHATKMETGFWNMGMAGASTD